MQRGFGVVFTPTRLAWQNIVPNKFIYEFKESQEESIKRLIDRQIGIINLQLKINNVYILLHGVSIADFSFENISGGNKEITEAELVKELNNLLIFIVDIKTPPADKVLLTDWAIDNTIKYKYNRSLSSPI